MPEQTLIENPRCPTCGGGVACEVADRLGWWESPPIDIVRAAMEMADALFVHQSSVVGTPLHRPGQVLIDAVSRSHHVNLIRREQTHA